MRAAPTPDGHFQELIELDEVVAERAGNRRAAGQILVDERLHHLLFEAASKFTT